MFVEAFCCLCVCKGFLFVGGDFVFVMVLCLFVEVFVCLWWFCVCS